MMSRGDRSLANSLPHIAPAMMVAVEGIALSDTQYPELCFPITHFSKSPPIFSCPIAQGPPSPLPGYQIQIKRVDEQD